MGTGYAWRVQVEACVSDATGYVEGASGAQSGNTLSCRAYHLSVAKRDFINGLEDSPHCNHAAPSGGGVL